MCKFIERHFIWVIIGFSIITLFKPSIFAYLKPFIPALLGIIMFCIGFTLNLGEFQKTWSKRWVVLISISIKYVVMPFAAYVIGIIYNLSLPELLGIVIIGSCPGGTAANIMSYLSKANTAFTVILTFGTTLIAPLVTPALIYLLLHKHISIPFWGIFNSMIFIVLFPIIAGILIKKILWKKIQPITKVLPVVSIIAVALAISCIIALTHNKFLTLPARTISAAITLNLLGYLLGLLTSKFLQCKIQEQRSITFEFGMFDSGLGVVIATNFFGPIAALPGVFISIIQSITASMLVRKYLHNSQIKTIIPSFKQP